MIYWRIHKDTIDTLMPLIRLDRRIDVTVAISMLKEEWKGDDENMETQRMFVPGVGYVKLSGYLFYLENGVEKK